ncbi:MAG: precorrin-2 dehydrogenase/sirohydrochlorin ferrochelatase family protein [Desulforhopalus sp.]
MLLYPVNLNLTSRLCLVVGGGPVALRKTRGLLAGGADVRIISPKILADLLILVQQGEVEWFEREFVEGDLKGVFMVFAATNDQKVQARIMEEATRDNVLVNSVDDPRGSDFHVPAHFRRGSMLVTVATGGGSPALARLLRRQLEESLDPGYGAVVELLGLIRDEIVTRDDNFDAHGRLFRRLLEKDLVELTLKEQWFDLQVLLLQELPKDVDAVTIMKKLLENQDKPDRKDPVS